MTIRNLPIAATVFVAGAAMAAACTTTTAAPTGNGNNSSSATSSTSTSGTSAASTGSGSTSSAGGTQTVADSGGTGVTTTCTVPPIGDGGFAPLITFNTQCGGDAGPNLACFGTYPTLYGGTFSYSNTTDSTPNDAGVGCTTFGSQSTFAVTLNPTADTWTWSGVVGSYVGGGLYIVPCVNAQAFTGIQFTIYGTVGATEDGGTGDEVQVSISDLEDWGVPSAGGVCPLATDGGPLTVCNPFSASFPVAATAADGVVQIPFSSLVGGGPDTTFDPAHIIQIQWQLPWPCTGGTPYTTNVTIQDVGFYQ
ncbi:MAG TPA: hypothetical protein VEK07_17480 [Polyangiaceae bacterium]|nr:hypothetical protein [Polyangiaceae bacterium]